MLLTRHYNIFVLSLSNIVSSRFVSQPAGGVRQGQTFWAVPESVTSSEATPFFFNNVSYQHGYDDDDDGTRSGSEFHESSRWNDGLFDCFRLGLFHPTVWNALCCPQLLMGQVLTRLNMTWLGEERIKTMENIYFTSTTGTPTRTRVRPATRPNCWSRRSTFTQVLMVVCLYWILTTALAPPKVTDDKGHDVILVPSLMIPKSPLASSNTNTTTTYIGAEPVLVPHSKKHKGKESKEDKELNHTRKFLYNTISWIFGLYTLVVLTRLRRAVRQRYGILSAAAFDGFGEDFCISFWCGCCSVAQMARQTCDDDDVAACCTTTGLKPKTTTTTSIMNSNASQPPPTHHRSSYLDKQHNELPTIMVQQVGAYKVHTEEVVMTV
jgi:Cys-rich protein (TIGR01571 family)